MCLVEDKRSQSADPICRCSCARLRWWAACGSVTRGTANCTAGSRFGGGGSKGQFPRLRPSCRFSVVLAISCSAPLEWPTLSFCCLVAASFLGASGSRGSRASRSTPFGHHQCQCIIPGEWDLEEEDTALHSRHEDRETCSQEVGRTGKQRGRRGRRRARGRRRCSRSKNRRRSRN
jgi:hypothetical protein